MSGIPNTFWDTDLQRLNCSDQIANVGAWLKAIEDHKATPGLLLHGQESGTGKTRVGTWAFNQSVVRLWPGRVAEARNVKTGDDDKCGLWFNVNQFREKYRRILRDEEAKAEWQHELSNCHALFLDDADKLKPSEGLMELVFSVLDERLTYGRHTIITTNLTGQQLEQRWGDEVGPYLVRRLREFALCIDFDAEAQR